jgi:CBS-domain-containing membrane protein
MKVCDVMTPTVVSVGPEATFKEIIERMRAARVSGLPVVDERRSVIGVVSESDLLLKEHRADHISFSPPFSRHGSEGGEVRRRTEGRLAGELMTSPALTIAEDADLRAGARLLTLHSIGRLPVTRDGRLVGILARSDVLKAFLRSDADISREVTEEVLGAKVLEDTSGVVVEVRDGVVALRGSVERLSTARLIAFHVDRIDGVTSVENHLEHTLDDLVLHEPSPLLPILGPLEQIL